MKKWFSEDSCLLCQVFQSIFMKDLVGQGGSCMILLNEMLREISSGNFRKTFPFLAKIELQRRLFFLPFWNLKVQ